jgi:hypothetical protein
MAPELWGRQWIDASCELDVYCLCEHGLSLSPEYTEDIISALKSNSADYDACKEEDEALKQIKRAVGGWKFIYLLLLAAILGSNVAILVTVRRRLGVSGSGGATQTFGSRSGAMEQPLLPSQQSFYTSLPADDNRANRTLIPAEPTEL